MDKGDKTMKARVIATDRIIEVMCVMNVEGIAVWEDISGVSTCADQYTAEELEFLDFPTETRATYNPDYWTRLEHQYAGMAMQGLLTNTALAKLLHDDNASIKDKTGIFSAWAKMYAHALVQKLKKKEENK